MLERIQNINTINIRQPKEYQKFEYDVEIDGQKQNASIEKFPNGKVKINLGDGKNNKTIITDEKGLIEFNKKHQKQDKIFNSQEEKKQKRCENHSLIRYRTFLKGKYLVETCKWSWRTKKVKSRNASVREKPRDRNLGKK